MKLKRVSEEVFYGEPPAVKVDEAGIDSLKKHAESTLRKRARICSHPAPEDSLHEMIIVHDAGAYVRPHRHLGRSESFHVISGEADIVFFELDGTIRDAFRAGEFASGNTFYYRLAPDIFHTLLIRTPWFVFHEVTSGPFRPETTEFAPWAPEDGAPEVADYIRILETRIFGRVT